VEGSASSKTIEGTAHRVRAIDVGALATPRASVPPMERKDCDSAPGLTGTLSGSGLGRAALRREQWERLEGNHHENQARGDKGESDHRQEKNGCTPVGYLG
jgi:hypothetical protein